MKPDDPAFPFLPTQDRHANTSGMSLRAYFAAKAPISYIDACLTCGYKSQPSLDADRAVVIAVLVMMQREYADALLAELNK